MDRHHRDVLGTGEGYGGNSSVSFDRADVNDDRMMMDDAVRTKVSPSPAAPPSSRFQGVEEHVAGSPHYASRSSMSCR